MLFNKITNYLLTGRVNIIVGLIFNRITKTIMLMSQCTAKLFHHLLDYCTTYPIVELRYHKNDMILHIPSNNSYLVALYTKNRISDYFFPSSNTTK